MKKTTLIAPFDDPLALAAAGEARILGRSVAALLPRAANSGGGKAEAAAGESRDFPISWNPPSYVSARAAVLEAAVRYGAVDEAVIVASPGPAPGLDAKPAEIEKVVHDRVLGVFWLARELIAKFSERDPSRGPGRLVFVLADRGEPLRGPIAAAAFGALESFSESLTEISQDSPYDVWTVQDSCPQDDLTAQFIARILETARDRKTNRVVKFSGKSGFFNRL